MQKSGVRWPNKADAKCTSGSKLIRQSKILPNY